MSFELREHTADVAVEARGETLGETFAAVADGLAAAHVDSWPDDGERHDVSVAAEGREALLFDYLDDLVYERDVLGVLPVDNEATVARDGDRWVLEGGYRGVPLAGLHAREVKAVTYSQMAVRETNGGYSAYVVFDV